MASRITIEPGKRSGQPCIRGLRITVWDVLNWLAAGMTEQQIRRLPRIGIRRLPRCLRVRGQNGPARRSVKLLFDENLSRKLVHDSRTCTLDLLMWLALI
jgi:uncharacterized protein (DUF433 family)